LVFSIRYTTWKVNITDARFYTGRPESWCIKYSVTSSVKQMLACQLQKHNKCTAEATDISIRSMQRIISEGIVPNCTSLSLSQNFSYHSTHHVKNFGLSNFFVRKTLQIIFF
jgi:hypothetical protein